MGFMAVLVAMVLGCSSGEDVKIGTLLDLTGDLAVYGKPMQNGANLAVSLLNEAGGILDGQTVVAVHKDSGTSSTVASDAARALLAEDVQGIVGSLSSGVTMAVANSVTIPGGAVLVSPASTSPAITVMDDNDFLYRSTVSDAAQGAVLGKLADELGFKSAGILYVNNPYGEGLANVFNENFSGAVTAVPHESEMASYLSELKKATANSPDVLIAMSYPASAGVYLREAVEGGYADTFMFVDGTKSQDMFDALGAGTFEGMYGTAPGAPATNPGSATFKQLYEAEYGELPTDPFLGETFDATVMIALAIHKAGSTSGSAIKGAIRDVSNAPGTKVGPGDLATAIDLISEGTDIDYEGVAGSQEIDSNGDVLNTIEVWTISGGKVTSTGRYESP